MKYIKFANGKPLEVSDLKYRAIRKSLDTMLRLRCEIWREQRRIEQACGAELARMDEALAEVLNNDDCLPPGTEGDDILADFLLDVRLMRVGKPYPRPDEQRSAERVARMIAADE